MIPVGWFVFICTLAVIEAVVLVVLFLRQTHQLVQAVIAKNSSDLVMMESAKPRPRRSIVEHTGEFDEDTRPRVMGLSG